jgi:hypothetical protein
MYWAYLHQNKTVQIKYWSGDHDDYTTDCEGNDFVLQVVRPFEATSYETARKIAEGVLLHPPV